MNLARTAAAALTAAALTVLPATQAQAAGRNHCHITSAWRHIDTASTSTVRVKLWARTIDGDTEVCAEAFDRHRSSHRIHLDVTVYRSDEPDSQLGVTGGNVRTIRVPAGGAYAIAAWATVAGRSVMTAWNRETDR